MSAVPAVVVVKPVNGHNYVQGVPKTGQKNGQQGQTNASKNNIDEFDWGGFWNNNNNGEEKTEEKAKGGGEEFDWMFWNNGDTNNQQKSNEQLRDEILKMLKASEAIYLSRLVAVEETMKNLKQENEELKEDILELREDRDSLQEDIFELQEDNTKLRENMLEAINLAEESRENAAREQEEVRSVGSNFFGSIVGGGGVEEGPEESDGGKGESRVSMQFIREEMAADVLQGVVFRWILRRRLKKERKASIKIQAIARGYLARQPHRMKHYKTNSRQFQREEHAIIDIQRMVRGYIVYGPYKRRCERKIQRVVALQALVRGFLARRPHKLSIAISNYMENQRRLKAILLVQTLGRGWVIRNRLKKKKLQNEAAKKIQGLVRRFLVRCKNGGGGDDNPLVDWFMGVQGGWQGLLGGGPAPPPQAAVPVLAYHKNGQGEKGGKAPKSEEDRKKKRAKKMKSQRMGKSRSRGLKPYTVEQVTKKK